MDSAIRTIWQSDYLRNIAAMQWFLTPRSAESLIQRSQQPGASRHLEFSNKAMCLCLSSRCLQCYSKTNSSIARSPPQDSNLLWTPFINPKWWVYSKDPSLQWTSTALMVATSIHTRTNPRCKWWIRTGSFLEISSSNPRWICFLKMLCLRKAFKILTKMLSLKTVWRCTT